MRLICLIVALVGAAACQNPDLAIEPGPPQVDLAGTGVPGGSLRVGPWRMTNRGSARARSAHGVITSSYHLSSDPVVTTSDRRLKGLASADLLELGPGESHQFAGDKQIAIPEDVAPGTYYFGIVVDSGNGVIEADETNNVAVVRIGVVRSPD